MIKPGKHAVIVGQNGSGKSQMLMKLALENEQQSIIFDTKLDDDFLYLAKKSEVLKVVTSYIDFVRAVKKGDFDYLIVRPTKIEIANPKALDNYLDFLTSFKNFSIFIDEAYPFHAGNGRCYEGLNCLLTRGRSYKLSVICCTQRPAFISNFIYSESSYFFVYRLMLLKDRKVVSDFIPYPKDEILENFHYYQYDIVENFGEVKTPIDVFKRKKQSAAKNNVFKLFSTR